MSQGKRLVDFIFLKDFLKLFVKFFSGKKQLQRAKSMHKKIISMGLPIGIELVLASKAVPLYLCRIGDYSSDPNLRALRLYQNIFGWDLTSRGMKFLRAILGDQYFSNIIDQILSNLFSSYEEFIAIAENEGAPLDACFGTRMLLGSTWPQLNNIHATFGYGTRCNWFSKVFEEIGSKSPLVLLEIPNNTAEYAEEMMLESLNQTIAHLEEITGQTITNENIRKQVKLTNQIRNNYLRILGEWSNNQIGLHPLAFSMLLCLLQLGFTDLLCSPKFFNRTLEQLGKTLQKNPRRLAYDTSSMPKFILVNAIAGYDPHLPRIIDELNGRLFIADAAVFKLLEPIETEGDILRNYAQNLLQFEAVWMDNTSLVERYTSIALKYNLDGILFNSAYGCKSITPSLRLFKERLQDSELTLIDIGFQNIGDSYEQLKTRIGAAIEILRERMV
ncbi:MAG: 2-hydroxyacyl-CoA dehydratase [Candidatus Helarchaeota archaeon]